MTRTGTSDSGWKTLMWVGNILYIYFPLFYPTLYFKIPYVGKIEWWDGKSMGKAQQF